MASHPPQAGLGADSDGVRISRVSRAKPTVSLLLATVGLPVIAIVVAVALIRLDGGDPGPTLVDERTGAAPLPANEPERGAGAARDRGAVDGAGSPASAGATREEPRTERFTPRRRSAAAAPPPAAPPATDGDEEPELDAIDVIPELRAAGEHGGIAAFGLPGTDPPKPGIIVPDGFKLPEGYVRHHQVSDDGEQLPAILMFHPDYDFLDARGNPMKLPENHVVPPDMAPPGLPIEMLEVPAPEGVRDPAP
jgi:hypothetical protein